MNTAVLVSSPRLATRKPMMVAMLLATMTVAAAMKLGTGAGLGGASQALELGVVFLSLILIGPGRYSLDARFAGGGAAAGQGLRQAIQTR